MNEKRDPYIGREFDGYRIECALGRGGMGTVYRAEDLKLRRPVAIKVMPQVAAGDRELVARFEREARVVAEFNHPNIAQVYRTGEIDSVPYYVMEYIEGRSLADMLAQNGRLAGNACIKLMIQAAQGLKAAAARQVIHRDIKPANLMVTKDGLLKIVDFGIAKVFRDDTFQTATGVVMGTPRYIAPEQARGVAIDHRADIYSLGATFYHMVTGKPPFDADDPVTLVMKHVNEPVRPIPEINPNVPDSLCRIVYRMLEKSPARRYQEYAQLVSSLEDVFASAGQSTILKPRAARPGAAPGMPEPTKVPPPVVGGIPEEKPAGWGWKMKLTVGGAIVLVVILLAIPALRSGGGSSSSGARAGRDSGPVDLNRALEENNEKDMVRAGLKMIKDARREDEKDAETITDE